MGTDSFIIHIKTKDFYEDIEDDVKKWFNTSNYDDGVNRPLSKCKNKKKKFFSKMNQEERL